MTTAPPHAPETGWMRRLLGDYHVTGVFWYRFHRFGVSVLPNWGKCLLMPLFTTFFFLVLFKIRRAIASNLEAVLGPCGFFRRQARIYRTVWDFAWCLSERYETLTADCDIAFTVEGEELWRDQIARRQGFIVVTAHVGNWEVGPMLASTAYDAHIHIIREKEVDPKAQEFIRGLIEAQGGAHYTVHFADDDDPSLGATLLLALRRGEIVALQGDRPRATGRTIRVELFGKPVELPAGPAALARAAGVPLVPVFIFREGRKRSRVVFPEVIEVPDTGNRDRDIRDVVQRLVTHLETAIRRAPHQWFCFRELWPRATSD